MTEKKDIVESAIEKAKPILNNLTFGAFMGFCSGTAMKKIGKALAVVIGVGFIGLQSAVAAGYITVDWENVRLSIVKKMDANEDGKVNVDDAKAWWKKLKSILTNKVPAAGGFSVGFLYGVRHG